jgi:hypothetical protein
MRLLWTMVLSRKNADLCTTIKISTICFNYGFKKMLQFTKLIRLTKAIILPFIILISLVYCQKDECLQIQGHVIVTSIEYDTLNIIKEVFVYFDFVPMDSALKNQDTSECGYASRWVSFTSKDKSLKLLIDSLGVVLGANFEAVAYKGSGCGGAARYRIPIFKGADIIMGCMRQPN